MAHTEIILTTNIPSLGAEADLVKVRRGYARNFLLPRGKGLEVTKSSLHQINHLKAKRAEREGREVTAAEEIAAKISKLKMTFTLETGETGKAFGSVTAKDIHDRIASELNLAELPKHAVVLDKAKVVDYGSDSLILRVEGESEKVDAFIGLLKAYGIVELVRSGKILMARGLDVT